MADSKNGIWFPAKKYGWGWGFPVAWQGWAVIAGYAALAGLGIVFLRPRTSALLFVGYLVFITGLLICLCWIKGEKPRWRWGDK